MNAKHNIISTTTADCTASATMSVWKMTPKNQPNSKYTPPTAVAVITLLFLMVCVCVCGMKERECLSVVYSVFCLSVYCWLWLIVDLGGRNNNPESRGTNWDQTSRQAQRTWRTQDHWLRTEGEPSSVQRFTLYHRHSLHSRTHD